MDRIALDFADRAVLVTGAGRGIGAAIARMFAQHGADVALVARSGETVEQTAAEIAGETGRRCVALAADVTDPDQVAAMVDRAMATFGRIDVLVNNAGGSMRGSLRTLSVEQWQAGRALNLDAAAYCTMKVGEVLLAQGGGAIVNISSVAGINGTMGELPYSSAKAGLQMFTRVAAAEWGRYGVRVNCVAPGMTVTEGMQSRVDRGIYKLDEITQRFPLRRAGTMAEVANAVLFLASDYASYITGQTLAVDGGPPLSGFTD